MELPHFHNSYDNMGYENEVTKKIVWKILNNMNSQNDITLERIQQTRYMHLILLFWKWTFIL